LSRKKIDLNPASDPKIKLKFDGTASHDTNFELYDMYRVLYDNSPGSNHPICIIFWPFVLYHIIYIVYGTILTTIIYDDAGAAIAHMIR